VDLAPLYGLDVSEVADQTLGHFIAHQLGDNLVVGDHVEWQGLIWTVAEMDEGDPARSGCAFWKKIRSDRRNRARPLCEKELPCLIKPCCPACNPLAPAGQIEGFFGKGWSWEARARYAQWLPRHGYGFYLYAPKEDGYLRKHWANPWPAAQLEALRQLARQCRDNGLAFGVGLSPMGAHTTMPASARPAGKGAAHRGGAQTRHPGHLFDDMKGDTPDLAHWQLTIAHDIAAHTRAGRLLFCPSYYSTDPVLEKVFGAMPPHYLQDLGQGSTGASMSSGPAPKSAPPSISGCPPQTGRRLAPSQALPVGQLSGQ
jgi:hypothetical protein